MQKVFIKAKGYRFIFVTLQSLNSLSMSCILHIETSTDACSVAVSQDGANIFFETTESINQNEGENAPTTIGGHTRGGGNAQMLGVLVDQALSFTDNHAIPFDAVAVSSGPGSYTGLRIGVSMAKGVCYGRNLKLISIPTLQLMCVPVLLCNADELPDDALLCPMIDARRMEVYTALYDRALHTVMEVEPMVIDSGSFREELDKRPIYFFGNGSDKCKEVINHPNAHFIEGITPLAKWMSPLAEKKNAMADFEDVAYFEPFYLKEFVALKSKKLL